MKNSKLSEAIFLIHHECATNAGNSCIIEKIVLSEDLAYFFELEYSNRADLRFLTQIEAGIRTAAGSNPPLVTVSLTSIPPQAIPEPSVVLGILTVLGLGIQFKKAF
ncbi:MAG: PEP-CTERM sorting domain-containing protein [Microcoleaceae cyanobacterium]